MSFRPYDYTNPKSIYNYSKGMIGKTFNKICDEDIYQVKEDDNRYSYESKRRKGGLGELVEERYFKYESNNDSGPDFKEAGVELKVAPYKINKNGTISSKERMVITMIDYHQIVKLEFFNNRVWYKSRLILMVFYLWEKEIKDRLDYRVDYTYLYSPPKEDLKIIVDDYNYIRSKVKEGRAHELSEGDTVYLGAATKASSSKDRTSQPNSDIPAKPRAFSFKNSYMTYILNNYVVIEGKKNSQKTGGEKIIKGLELNNKTFEEYILEKINKFRGMEVDKLIEVFYKTNDHKEIDKIKSSKSLYSSLTFRMLGINSNSAEEFEKANIVVKSIRLKDNNKIRESMSFPAFKIKDLVEEKWEESDVYKYFESTKFLFSIFEKMEDKYIFRGAFFWNMPSYDLEESLKEDWEMYINKFKSGVKLTPKRYKNGKVVVRNDLPKKAETNLMHVRPHASLSASLINGKKYGRGSLEKDSDELLDGNRITKQSFWLNNTYIEKIVEKGLKNIN